MIAENRQLTNSGRHPGPHPVEEQEKHHGAGEDVGLPVQVSLTITVRRPGAWTARARDSPPVRCRCRWPRGRVTAAAIGGYPPGSGRCTTAPRWSLRRVQWRMASGHQRHISGRSSSQAGRRVPTRERGTISVPTSLRLGVRGTAMTAGIRMRRSSMATWNKAVPVVILRARATYRTSAGGSQPVGRWWWSARWGWWGTGVSNLSQGRPSVSACLRHITCGAPGPGATVSSLWTGLMLSPRCLSVTRGTLRPQRIGVHILGNKGTRGWLR